MVTDIGALKWCSSNHHVLTALVSLLCSRHYPVTSQSANEVLCLVCQVHYARLWQHVQLLHCAFHSRPWKKSTHWVRSGGSKATVRQGTFHGHNPSCCVTYFEISTYLFVFKFNTFQYLDEIWMKIRILEGVHDFGQTKNDILFWTTYLSCPYACDLSLMSSGVCRVWQGYKEVTLLGQNVNSYRDTSALNFTVAKPSPPSSSSSLSAGFHTVYRSRPGGLRFASLLTRVADVNPEMRIRFTSPHPKDFPDDVVTPLHCFCSNSSLHLLCISWYLCSLYWSSHLWHVCCLAASEKFYQIMIRNNFWLDFRIGWISAQVECMWTVYNWK